MWSSSVPGVGVLSLSRHVASQAQGWTCSPAPCTFTRAHVAPLFSLINPERKELTKLTLGSLMATEYTHLYHHFNWSRWRRVAGNKRKNVIKEKTRPYVNDIMGNSSPLLCKKNPVVPVEDNRLKQEMALSAQSSSNSLHPQDRTPPASGSHILMNAEGGEALKHTYALTQNAPNWLALKSLSSHFPKSSAQVLSGNKWGEMGPNTTSEGFQGAFSIR